MTDQEYARALAIANRVVSEWTDDGIYANYYRPETVFTLAKAFLSEVEKLESMKVNRLVHENMTMTAALESISYGSNTGKNFPDEKDYWISREQWCRHKAWSTLHELKIRRKNA